MKRRLSGIPTAVAVILSFWLLAGCGGNDRVQERRFLAFGTLVDLSIHGRLRPSRPLS